VVHIVTDAAGQVLGVAGAIIDLTNPEAEEMGGRDPRAPMMIGALFVQGQLNIGHTYDLANPDARIYLEEQPERGRVRDPDLRCDECVTKTDIGYQHGMTWVVMEHTRSCTWLARIAREHPPASVS